jgi:LmbE family N-acetylglucosaminyl deacetylase
MDQKRYMVIGAHPDDCESVAGIMLQLLDRGGKVKFLTATNGASGHQEMMGGALALRRQEETRKVTGITGIEYEILDNTDAFLTASLPERHEMLRAIRRWSPDVIITHRPNDYHPDHRNTSVLVQDCSFLVMVPNVCPLTPPLRHMPAIFYMQDSFRRPYPFSPDLVFDIDCKLEEKLRMYHQYTSQMYEWLPWVGQLQGETIPDGDEARFEWLRRSRFAQTGAGFANRFRAGLVQKYGAHGEQVQYAEALEICEYGAGLTPAQLAEYFPF